MVFRGRSYDDRLLAFARNGVRDRREDMILWLMRTFAVPRLEADRLEAELHSQLELSEDDLAGWQSEVLGWMA